MDYAALPKTIWIYWDQGVDDAPFLVQKCIESWKSFNPAWEIRPFDRKGLSDLVDMDGLDARADIPLQHFSDLLRVRLLSRHGGVWADASLFCVSPLDSWLPEYFFDGFFAFSSRRQDRVVSNWFLAACKNNNILLEWANEMFEFWKGHRFRKGGYISRQLIRKLMSLRKRNIVPNNIWFTRIFTKTLRLFPYPVNMYIFERMLEHYPELRVAWSNRRHLYDEPSERLQNHYGMNSALTTAARDFMDNGGTPVHKLNWRQDLGRAMKGSNFEYLISFIDASN